MMNDIQIKFEPLGRGQFVVEENGERLAEMEFSVSADNLIVYHTEVSPKLQGQGIAGKLLETMVSYARKEKLKVVPLCPYVSAQFNRNPEKYNDVWNKHWHDKK